MNGRGMNKNYFIMDDDLDNLSSVDKIKVIYYTHWKESKFFVRHNHNITPNDVRFSDKKLLKVTYNATGIEVTVKRNLIDDHRSLVSHLTLLLPDAEVTSVIV